MLTESQEGELQEVPPTLATWHGRCMMIGGSTGTASHSEYIAVDENDRIFNG